MLLGIRSVPPILARRLTVRRNNASTAAMDLSLHRIVALLDRLGRPQRRFAVIHVAGTNGKGSTVHYLSAVLRDVVGLRIGTFTTPHLREERDACKVDGEVMDGEVWTRAATMVDDAASAVAHDVTPFERLTARCFVAWSLLSTPLRPDVLLVEVGMGGALDATNVFDDRQVLASVIGAIDLDHQAMLGDTLGEIATHKAGIVKQGGLCVVADQRRNDDGASDEVDCTRITKTTGSTNDVDSIVESIRKTCEARNARMVKAFTPWQALHSDSTATTTSHSPWSAYTTSHVRFAPTLSPSKVRKGDYVAATGDAVVPGPTLHLPATRASLMGAHLALQTLWSVARDESPCGLGLDGADASEAIRLQIAFALRDERAAKREIERCIEQAHLAGRAEWVDVRVPSSGGEEEEEEEEAVQSARSTGNEEVKLASSTVTLHALLDGAHNPAAAIALRRYIDTCIARRRATHIGLQSVTLTWIFALSRGKAVAEMAAALFTSQCVDAAVAITHRIAAVPFSTPVEGMPWVQCVAPDEIVEQVQQQQHEARAFTDLSSALLWASEHGDGASLSDDGTHAHILVIAGSLYLVSDVHRLLTS